MVAFILGHTVPEETQFGWQCAPIAQGQIQLARAPFKVN
jgi:hypothetical protein